MESIAVQYCMSPCFRIPYSTAPARTKRNLEEPIGSNGETLFGIGRENGETEGLKDKRLRQEEAVSVSKVRSRFHLEEKQRSPRELRVRPRAKISVPLLRTEEQANVARLRPHQEETSWRGGVHLRHEAVKIFEARISFLAHFANDRVHPSLIKSAVVCQCVL